MIEVDPKIEQAFAEVLARGRNRAADITDRLAAKQREINEASDRITEEGKRVSQELDRQVAQKRENARNPWQNRESKSTVMAFGDDDEERRPAHQPAPAAPAVSYPVMPPPPAPPQPEPEPRQPAPERMLSFGLEDDEADSAPPTPPRPSRPAPAADDEDDDWSGRSWVR